MRVIILFFLIVMQICADDASYNRGEMLYFSNACSSCHGPSAEGSTTYPRLANKDNRYLIKKLKYFRVGRVDTVQQQMMSQFATKLSDKEIEDLSYFLSTHKKNKIEDVGDDLLGGFGS